MRKTAVFEPQQSLVKRVTGLLPARLQGFEESMGVPLHSVKGLGASILPARRLRLLHLMNLIAVIY